MLVVGIIVLIVGAALVVVPQLAQLAPLGWIAVVVGVALIAVALLHEHRGSASVVPLVPFVRGRLAAGLRLVANRLDPPPKVRVTINNSFYTTSSSAGSVRWKLPPGGGA